MKTQNPKVRLEKRPGRKSQWVASYYDAAGVHRSKTFGPRSEMTKSAAQLALNELIGLINNERALRNLSAKSTLAQYTEGSYLPHGRRKWKASTAITTEQRIRQHVMGAELGDVRVADLSRSNMQAFLDRRGECSESLVKHLRWDLVAILDLAISDGLIDRNQARQLYVPSTVKLPSQPVMTAGQVTQALGVLDLRERLFCRLAIYAGMRPGEIIALKWPDVAGGRALVDDRYYKGEAGTTKNRKARKVALSASVQADLEHWRPFAVDSEGFIFASEAGTPIKYENLWQRDIRPRFEKIGLAWADFRAMRRTNSTLMKAAGADPKVSADNRGHGVGVSMDVYTQSTDEQKSDAVKKLEESIQ